MYAMTVEISANQSLGNSYKLDYRFYFRMLIYICYYRYPLSIGILNINNATKDMKKLKGKCISLYEYFEEDNTIRHKFKAPNKYVSLIHSSDDWDSFINEVFVFFTLNEVENTIQKICNNELNNAFLDKVELEFMDSLDYSLGSYKLEKISPFKLFIQIRLRILKIIIDSNIIKIDLTYIYKYWYKNLKDISNLDIKEQYIRYQMILEEESEYINTIFNQIKKTEINYKKRWYIEEYSDMDLNFLISFLKILNDFQDYNIIDIEYYLTKIDIFYDDWEKILFETTIDLLK